MFALFIISDLRSFSFRLYFLMLFSVSIGKPIALPLLKMEEELLDEGIRGVPRTVKARRGFHLRFSRMLPGLD